MFSLTDDNPRFRLAWSKAVRGVRRRSGRKVPEMARMMGMGLRSYQAFEAGCGPLSLDRLHRFAKIANCDPFALMFSVSTGNADIAAACAGNKLMTLLILRCLDLTEALGDAIPALTPAQVYLIFDPMFADLQARVRALIELKLSPSEIDGPARVGPDMILTARQLECLEWVQAGKSSTDIGLILNLSRRTVDGHILEMCKLFGVRSRVQAVAAAIRLGILPG